MIVLYKITKNFIFLCSILIIQIISAQSISNKSILKEVKNLNESQLKELIEKNIGPSNLKKDSKTNVLDKQNKIKKLIDSDASVNNPKLDQNLVKIPKSNTSTDKNNVQSKDLLNPIEKIDVVSGTNDNSPAQVYFGYDILKKVRNYLKIL